MILNKVIKLYPTFDNGVSHAHYYRVLHRVLMTKIPRMNGSPAYHGLLPSPIYTALIHGPPEILKALAEAGADVNSPQYPPRGTSPGISALRLCLTQRCGLQKLKILLELGAKDATDESDSPTTSISLIKLALRNLDFDTTMLLLENNFDPDPWPKSDRTALQLALFPESPKKECDDSTELAKLLCSKGVDPNLVAQKDRLTPLQQAIEHGNLEIVELLFEHHANVNKHSEPDVEFDLSATHQPNEESLTTPLQLAIKEQHPAIIKTLLKHGADVNLRAKRCGPPGGGHVPSILHPFLTPLQLALYTSQPEYVEMLLEHGADINAPPIHKAVPQCCNTLR